MWKYYITNNFAPTHTVLAWHHTTKLWNPIKACLPLLSQKQQNWQNILPILNAVDKSAKLHLLIQGITLNSRYKGEIKGCEQIGE